MENTVILYPAPGIGHLISMVELGKLLHHHYPHKFTISILLTTASFDSPSTATYISRISLSHPSISFHRFPPPHPPTTTTTSNHSFAAKAFDFINRNSSNVLTSLQQISQKSTIKALIIDFFCGSALQIGKDLNIPTYYFFTSGAACAAAFLYLPKIHEQTDKSFKDLTDSVFQFPGLPDVKAIHMPEPVLDRTDPAYIHMIDFCKDFAKSDGILVNTFKELEPIAVSVNSTGKCVAYGTTTPFYHIGPLIADSNHERLDSENECLNWLKLQPDRSVVFLCFGSRGRFSAEQLTEIAMGLENSGHRFLWVAKSPTENKSIDLDLLLPEGFMDRVKNRGMVVRSWAPQVEILKMKSVGGFVTHCGWNSVLEAVVGGVPMVAWPLYAEQYMNRGFLVEQMGMAIPVEIRESDGFVTRTELEKRVKELMESENGKVLREKSEKMKETAMEVFGRFGSSAIDVSRFVQGLEEV